jgi:hypothetical protein
MKDECPIWSEKLLVNGKCSGMKDVLLGKLNSPNFEDESNNKAEDIKFFMKNADPYKMTYT